MDKDYFVRAEVTISVHTRVRAPSQEQAFRVARERRLCTLGDPERFGDTEDDAWLHSGEIDGEPEKLTAEEDDRG